MKRHMVPALPAVLTAVAALALVAGGAASDPCVDVTPLVAFIEDHTDFTGLPRCQVIGRFDTAQGPGLMMSQAGAYDPVGARISVAQDLDLTSVLGQSYLLHEIVHFAQFHSDVAATARCPAALEAQAYALQTQFLRSRGEAEAAGLIAVLAVPLTLCRQDLPDY